MKKLYKKINNKQWRMTVPNINGSIFKRGSRSPEEHLNRNSGFYDVQEAQKEYENSRSVPSSVYFLESSSEDDSKEEVCDKIVYPKTTDAGCDDGEVYANIETVTSEQRPSSIGSAEYDVPRISFKFFDKQKTEEIKSDETYENTRDGLSSNTNSVVVHEPNYEIISEKPITTKPRLKSEMKIVLTAVEIDIEGEDTHQHNGHSEKYVQATDPCKSRSTSQEYFSTTCIALKTHQNDNAAHMRKCGSDPNINITNSSEEDEENFYKVPRSLKEKRFSQSLKDFNIDDIDRITKISDCSRSTSIDHISCSQFIRTSEHDSDETIKLNSSSEMDYMKARGRFPRLTLLKKPHSRWHNWKSKLSNMMIEQAAHQRVGAFENKPKVTINVEEVLKNSKSKCKNIIKNTGKMFNRRRRSTRNSSAGSNDLSNVDTPVIRSELKASDIEYKLNLSDWSDNNKNNSDSKEENSTVAVIENEDHFGTIRSTFGKIKNAPSVQGQNGFDDLRRYVKQGSDFCKELATILQDRAEAEATYAKSLSKLSSKLSRACREGVGTLNEGWKAVAQELEARAESHRLLGVAILEESTKPLRSLTDNQQKCRKQAESAVDKAAKSLGDWRAGEAKSKKHSHSCARENEKLQDAVLLDNSRLSRSASLIHLGNIQKNASDKDNAKMESKKKKAEEAVKKADIEYYTICVRAERARLEWESAVVRGADTFQSLEEERLNNLKDALTSYLQHSSDHVPRLLKATERLQLPIAQSEPTKDLTTFVNLRQTSRQISEQLLPDFYCEHITLAMNRERRKQSLVKLLHLIRRDIERERKSKIGLENLSKAIKQTPNFGAEDSQQSVSEKLYHMKSMLTYLEAARYKVQNALSELDCRPRTGHPLAPHITITRDKSGLQQSVLKVPQWLTEEWTDCEKSPVSEKSVNSERSDLQNNDIGDPPDWADRGAGDGNSNQPDSDFDEFSSVCSSTEGKQSPSEENVIQPIAQCKALYPYTPNLNDELPLKPGDILSVYRQQDDGWWLGECNGSVGIFPATYVELISA